MEEIFISIASYRDPDVINTIKDAVYKASNPKRVIFGVVFQGSKEEYNHFNESLAGENIKSRYYSIEETKGTGWARNILTRDMLEDEMYWLQIDSHTRFKKGWDNELIDLYNKIGHYCLLSAFPPHFGFDEPYEYFSEERKLNNKSYVVSLTEMNSFRETKGKIPEGLYEETITASGAFQFARNEVAKKLTFDEYFNPWMDQEITSCLAFMNGFPIYAPREAVLWHCYFSNHIGSDTKWRELVADDINIKGYEIYPFETIKNFKTVRTWQSWLERVMVDVNTKKDW